jgi:dTDP-glucose pyrophosphorylase
MTNIILMSGLGKRFSDVGFILPKPLIPVSGRPMFYLAIDQLPEADKWIFVVRKQHVIDFKIDEIIKQKRPDATIIIEEAPTGQAPSCLEAVKTLAMDEDFLVAACDNSFLLDNAKWNGVIKEGADMIVWSFTDDDLLSDNPTAWGWIKLETDGKNISDMSVKVPVSGDPKHDHAVLANFYFKNATDFIKAYNLMVESEYKINNEYYLDSLPVFYKKLGMKSIIFDVDLYVGWGKPADLFKYELGDYCYKFNLDLKPLLGGKTEKWLKYFKTIYENNNPSGK